jgi:hypothetical protein
MPRRVRSSKRTGSAAISATDSVGMYISSRTSRCNPLNDSAETPITVKSTLLSLTLRPMMPGSPEKREIHVLWFRITTGARSSSDRNVRPAAMGTPSTSKYSGLTESPMVVRAGMSEEELKPSGTWLEAAIPCSDFA